MIKPRKISISIGNWSRGIARVILPYFWLCCFLSQSCCVGQVPALSAGFVEEFVFRGYLQRQFQGLYGNTVVGSVLQVMVFSLGHYYQGWIRLVPVVLIGTLLTIVALWRKSLVPGMIAHGLGDGLVSFSFFLKHL